MAFTTPETFEVGQEPTAAEMNTLSTAIEELQTLLGDTDAVTSGLSITAGTDWSVTQYRFQRVAPRLASIEFDATYSGATITAGPTLGDITDTTVATLPAPWRASTQRSWNNVTVSKLWLPSWAGRIATTGECTIYAGPPGATISSGDLFHWSTVMPIAAAS